MFITILINITYSYTYIDINVYICLFADILICLPRFVSVLFLFFQGQIVRIDIVI